MGLKENCQDKLNGATHFLSEMEANLANPPVFRYNLWGFLATIRSPLQYILASADPNYGRRPRPNPPLAINQPMKTWYDTRMQSPVLSFFRDDRDRDIHARPTKPDSKVTLKNLEDFAMTGMVFGMPDKETGKTQTGWIGFNYVNEAPASHVDWEYEFTDASGTPDQDVLRLCRQCLGEVETVINDGISLGYM